MKNLENQNFPHIEHIDDVLPHIAGKNEFRLIPQNIGGEKWTTICYMITNNMTWDNDFARECRGITFDSVGNIAARPFHKFFNIGERECTQRHFLPWDMVHNIAVKGDGSLITACVLNGKVYARTKKTFDSDVAKLANAFIQQNQNYINFCLDIIKLGYTPMFEFMSPKSRIVINYQVETLALTAIRHNVRGDYMSRNSLEAFAKEYAIDIIPVADVEINEMFDNVETVKDIEGYVVQFSSGELVKLKTDHYNSLHHNVTFQRSRDVALMILEERLDDYKGYLKKSSASDSLAKVEAIELEISTDLGAIAKSVDDLYEETFAKGMTQKEIAASYCKHPHFSLLMKKAVYDDIDSYIIKFYERNFLKQKFGLEQL